MDHVITPRFWFGSWAAHPSVLLSVVKQRMIYLHRFVFPNLRATSASYRSTCDDDKCILGGRELCLGYSRAVIEKALASVEAESDERDIVNSVKATSD